MRARVLFLVLSSVLGLALAAGAADVPAAPADAAGLLAFLATPASLPAPAAAASCGADFCANQQAECLFGCPCAVFSCKPASCSSICTCPIFC